MPSLTVHGVAAHYRDAGKGPPVVLGHSSTGTGGQWRGLVEHLEGHRRLLVPDHLGYGRTGAWPGEPALFDHEVAIVAALLDRAGEPAHLVGHSYGGSILTRVALRYTARVRSLTLIEPTLFHLLAPGGRDAEHAEIAAVCDAVVRGVDAGDPVTAARGFIGYWLDDANAFDAMDERVRASVVAGMSKQREEWVHAAFVPAGATPEALAALPMPVQVVAGSRTTAAAAGVVAVLREILPGARHALVEGAGHMSPVTHAGDVNAVVEAFLDAVEDG